MKYIKSYTAQDLLDYRDPNFIHHDQYTSELEEPEIKYCYANTIVLEVKSSHYNDPEYVSKKTGKSKGYGLKYKVFVLLEDFYTIAKDKDIEFSDAVEYALRYGDVHVRCSCPSFLFWGYAYIDTQLRAIYGLPRENRYPHVRNPNVKGDICKHADKALTYLLQHKDIVKKMFEVYYDKFRSGQNLIAIDDTGNEVKIGTKDGNGDVFFERQLEQEEEHEMYERLREQDEQEIQEEPEEVQDPTDVGVDWYSDENDDESEIIEDEE